MKQMYLKSRVLAQLTNAKGGVKGDSIVRFCEDLGKISLPIHIQYQ